MKTVDTVNAAKFRDVPMPDLNSKVLLEVRGGCGGDSVKMRFEAAPVQHAEYTAKLVLGPGSRAKRIDEKGHAKKRHTDRIAEWLGRLGP